MKTKYELKYTDDEPLHPMFLYENIFCTLFWYTLSHKNRIRAVMK